MCILSRRRILAVASITMAAIWLAHGSPLSAHDMLVKSMPETGSSLVESPQEIALKFSGKPAAVLVRLLALDGTELNGVGDPAIDGRWVHIPVTEMLPDGSYKLTFRITSRDAHVIDGSIDFSVRHVPAPAQ